MNFNQDICDMKEDIMNTVTRVIEEVNKKLCTLGFVFFCGFKN